MTPIRLHRAMLTASAILILLSSPARGETLVLLSGGRIDGQVVKRTAETVFVDVGYTILAVPAKEVKEVEAAGPSTRAEAQAVAPPLQPGGIFTLGRGEAGSIKDKAREVAEGVVQVICPGKLGSGFIISEEGYVVTNCHVVESDQDIAVVIYVREDHDFRKVRLEQVRIIALNPFLDLALLKIEEGPGKLEGPGPEAPKPGGNVSRLRKVFLADSEAVRVGDPVFAVGSPLGLERTVTEGIVSNSRRALGGLIYLQTTASINPGNSGGPLFNDRGEVVGITSLKVRSGEALGFAIPVNYLKDFVRNREAFAFDKDHPNTGIRYLAPPRKPAAPGRAL